jgi:hypothetical protein
VPREAMTADQIRAAEAAGVEPTRVGPEAAAEELGEQPPLVPGSKRQLAVAMACRMQRCVVGAR